MASVKDALRIRRYVQLHSLPADDLRRRCARSAAGRRATTASPSSGGTASRRWRCAIDAKAAEAGRLLLEDERKFIDLPNSPLWWGEEKVIF